MAIVDGRMPPRRNWTKSMNKKCLSVMVKPNVILSKRCSTRIPEEKVHLVFACKHDGHNKGSLVAGGHLTPDPMDSIYSGVVSTTCLRLTIFLAKLNDMKVWAADIGNAYLEATTKEELYIVAEPEFEELQGHILVIHKAPYGLKSSGLRWSQRIDDIMIELNFIPCKADPCVWLREKTTKYKYIAIYVDALLIASDGPQKIIHDLEEKFKLKIKGDGPLVIRFYQAYPCFR